MNMPAGLPPPRPDQRYAPTGAPMAPGSPNVIRARLVIVSGPTGAVNGIFIYQPGTTPGAGNGPVLSGTESTADPSGNAVKPGWTSYAAPGSGTYAELINGFLLLNAAGANTPCEVVAQAPGFAVMSSGNAVPSDTPAAVSAQSASANGGQSLVALTAQLAQLTQSGSTIPFTRPTGYPQAHDGFTGASWGSGERALNINAPIDTYNAAIALLISVGISA